MVRVQVASRQAREAGRRPARAHVSTPAGSHAIRTIVVPLDGSALSETALEPAVKLAKRLGATLVFVQVPVPVRVPGLDTSSAYQIGEGNAERSLRNATQRASDDGVAATGLLVTGSLATPAAAILTAVRERRADLVVMATHGRTGVRRAMLGSVADEVTRDCPVPVILVRGLTVTPEQEDLQRRAPSDAAPREVTPARPLLVVALDGTPAAEAALGPAVSLARQLDGDLELVRVRDKRGAERFAPGDTGSGDGDVERYLEDTRRRLTGPPISLAPQRVRIASTVAASASVAEALLSHASRRGAAFIILATHARQGVDRLLRGSVEAAVVARATLPVVVVRAATGEGAVAPSAAPH